MVIHKIKHYVQLFNKGDLKIRYITALLIIAVLSIIQQVVTHHNLNLQQTSFKVILEARNHIEQLRDIRKNLLRVQASTDQKDANIEYKKESERLLKIMTKEAILWDTKQIDTVPQTFSIDTQYIDPSISHLQQKISERINSDKTNNSLFIENIFEVSNLIETYIEKSNSEIVFFENRITQKFSSLKQTELMILLVILSVLIFESFFIFTPAINKLDRALKARSDFFSRMGHEIRNPMNSILGMADLIEKNERDQTQLIYIKRLKKSAEGLLAFLNNIIEYAGIEKKKQKADISSIELKQLIDEVYSLFFLDASKKDLLLLVNIAPGTPLSIESDFLKLKHILVNLIGNAIKFTKQGYVALDLSFDEENEQLQIHVEDSGPGISENKQMAIFEEFVQADSSVKRKHGGTGLGLAIAKEYTEILDGKLYLESDYNEGAKFTIEFPVHVYSGGIKSDLSTFDNIYLTENDIIIDWVKKHTTAFNKIHYLVGNESIPDKPNQKNLVILRDYQQLKSSNIQANENRQILVTSPQLESIGNPYIQSHYPLTPWIPAPNIELQSKSYSTALICDDSEDNRLVLESYLGSYFSDIVTVDNGYDCLAKLKEGHFSAVFLDIQMPEIDGFTVMQEASKFVDKDKTIFIAFTAHNTFIEKLKMKEAGFTTTLEKPIRSKQVQELLYSLHLTEEKAEEPMKPQTEEENDFEKRVRQRLLNKKHLFVSQKYQQVSDFPQDAESMDQLDYLKTVGHQLKGSSSYYGYEELARWGEELEKMAKSKKLNDARDQLAMIKRFLEDEKIN